MLIDIEGTDGSGKATQTKLLYDYLVSLGKKCKIVSFPNYESASSGPVKLYLNGDLGENSKINSYQASAIFAIDRVCTMVNIVCSDYDYVLFDRYSPSNMIHQSTKIKDKKELDAFLDWVQDFEFNKLNLPKPDKILFLDMPVKNSISLINGRTELKNMSKRDILEEDAFHLSLAYERAKYVSKKFNWLHIDCVDSKGNIKDINEIHKEIVKVLNL